jgi:hypothetical protein
MSFAKFMDSQRPKVMIDIWAYESEGPPAADICCRLLRIIDNALEDSVRKEMAASGSPESKSRAFIKRAETELFAMQTRFSAATCARYVMDGEFFTNRN